MTSPSETIFTARFFRAAYQATTDLMAIEAPSETVELIPGEPAALLRLWEMPGASLKFGVLEPIHQALLADMNSPDDAVLVAAIEAATAAWRPFCDAVDGESMQLSVGADGQALQLPDNF